MAICPECRTDFPDDFKVCPEHGLALLPASIFSNEDRELEVGAHVGDYVVQAKLGEGSFGRVYRAVHPLIGRLVAVKVLNRALSTDPHAVSRFVAEARAIVEVASPHIVDVYSLGALPDGRQYYVMELLDGMSLDSFIKERGPLSVPVALRILAGMADALASAHQAGVVHRDLKPDNVLIVFDQHGDPWPKLLDFGVAKLLGDRKLNHHTSTGALVGTPSYMAPEQALGMEVDRRADIYAYGIVAFEMLTGRPPFEASSLGELIRMHATVTPPLLSAVRPELGTSLDAPIARLLEKDPDDRPQTMAEAIAELRDAAGSAGHDTSLPAYLSLRPPPAAPSAPGYSTLVVRGDASTVRVATPSVHQRPARSADTVGGTTGELVRASQGAPPRARTSRWLIAAGALAVAAGMAFGIVHFGANRAAGERPPAAPARATVAATAREQAAASAATASDDARARDSVTLTVECAVHDAHVFLGDADLGAVPGPFPLPRGEAPLRLEVRANDYETAQITLVPNANRTERPELVRSAGRRPGARTAPSTTAQPTAAAKAGPTVSPDLAEPYQGPAR